MERFEVTGGARLVGEVDVHGAKNSILKLMAATLLAPGEHRLGNVPAIADVTIMSELLERLGCQITQDESALMLTINVPEKLEHRADYDLVRKMRASINVLGPLLTRTGRADVALPGGDAIGSRGLDFHIKGLESLGAEVRNEHGYIVATVSGRLRGAQIELEFPSVGATENLLTAAVLARGETVIDNAAREPDIVDLGVYLQKMGAQISGLGTSTVTVNGVESLHPADHDALPDRIVTGTWAFAAAMTRGDITIHNANPDHLEIPLEKLVLAGAVVTTIPGGLRVRMDHRPKAVDAMTLPYPGFPTDLQPMIIALNSIAQGSALVTENVFEGRFMFINELVRLGADITTDGHHAFVKGKEMLSSAPVAATDIRAGAALVLAALVCDGSTIIEDIFHVDRGYPHFDEQLTMLGAQIRRM
ncbi:MAG: UDP-N-acetylglucosamine 1-carboxyvinyltransferase [Actinobacteria bacterium]|uniref:UDP-N-acetylglucosamine 1-carboxyvinyltransferase n=1 Tax=Candidatus Fonsibacter lacus TaxID=2576439 RepID=A0A965LL21_9PROT|nr:UDP-N-acetylglucosamine 1-carboxyvinyltransferase [Candidatus Fonsibacter lacus]